MKIWNCEKEFKALHEMTPPMLFWDREKKEYRSWNPDYNPLKAEYATLWNSLIVKEISLSTLEDKITDKHRIREAFRKEGKSEDYWIEVLRIYEKDKGRIEEDIYRIKGRMKELESSQ